MALNGARRARRTAAAVAATLAVATGAATVSPTPAGATPTFTLQRIAGADRYATAGVVDQAAFPAGEPTALLADGVPGHESDALGAAGVAGVFHVGVLLTDDTDTVPASTAAALQANKVQKIVVLGGTGTVSQAQIDQLQAGGYQVSTPYQGSTRYQTMKLVDESMGGAGTDGSGNPTAILASGEDSHLVDALAAGGLSYVKRFPIILTSSSGPALQPEAQQVIADMGIRHLIVAGGTASIPSSEYKPAPPGVTELDVAAGVDRSQTSQIIADYAIQKGWLKNTNLTVARGDDGADALAGAAYSGVNGWATVVTNSTTDPGTTVAFAKEHQPTLAGRSYAFGGASAVPDAELAAIQAAGQGPPAKPASAGTFGTAGGVTPLVDSESGTGFTEGGVAYTYGPADTYQIVEPGTTPGAVACVADSYADFQARLSNGDSVSGNYQPSGTSTFCLTDVAPHPPASVSASSNTAAGGTVIAWQDPPTAGTDNVTGYTIWRAPASPPATSGAPYTCPAVYGTAPGSSPQATPSSPYLPLITGYAAAGAATSYAYPDSTATPGSQYCYAVSAESPRASGSTQTGTAQPANANQLQPSQPGPVAASTPPTSTAPRSTDSAFTNANAGGTASSYLFTGDQLVVDFDQPVSVASSYRLTLAAACPAGGSTPDTCADSQAQLTPSDSTAGVSNGGQTVTFTLTTPPLISAGSSPTIALANLEVLSQSGLANGGGQPWNLPGSGVVSGPMRAGAPGMPASLRRVFAGTNAQLPAPPTVSYVAANGTGPNSNTVSYHCSDPGSDTLNIYDSGGTPVATAPCSGGGLTAAPGQPSPVTFTNGAVYLVTESKGVSPAAAGQESQTVSVTAGPQPAPRLTGASATAASANVTLVYNEPVACATVDANAGDYKVGSYATATGSLASATWYPAGAFAASCSGTSAASVTLTPSNKGPSSFPAGSTIVIQAQPGADGDTVCTAAAPNDVNCETAGDQAIATT